ncbi:MAG: Hsp70 family protein [Deinococcus sp.]|nr:Hsp70 family protein [Deinococcus sp.]
MTPARRAVILGIDLGTTNSVATVFDGVESRILPVDGDSRLLPSVVSYRDAEQALVGASAKRLSRLRPDTTFRSIKRRMGTDWSAPVYGRSLTPVDISTEILKKLLAEAERQLGVPVRDAVISAPAYFNARARADTRAAGERAGFNVLKIVPEPTAAALAYGFDKGTDQTILVYDLGGGTFDISVLEVKGNNFTTRCVDGDAQLGGDNFDELVASWLLGTFRAETGVDLAALPDSEAKRRAMQLSIEAAERAKIELSETQSTTIAIPHLWTEGNASHSLAAQLRRSDFEALILPLVERTREITLRALRAARLRPQEIDRVVLVGGSTHVPLVRHMLTDMLMEPYGDIDPATCVGVGAGIQAYLLTVPGAGSTVDVVPQPLGIRIERGSDKDLFEPLIPAQSLLPQEVTREYRTVADNQAEVLVEVYQGISNRATQNTLVGYFLLDGLAPAPRGQTRIDVTFRMDEDGILHASALDQRTRRAQHITIREFQRVELAILDSQSATADLVILMDVTGSMDPFINAMKDRAIAFGDYLARSGVDYHIALIGFGDLKIHEPLLVNALTSDIRRFKEYVVHLPRTHGGDIPESSLDALRAALRLEFRPQAQRIFVLITDAPPHQPDLEGHSARDVAGLLQGAGVVTYVVSRQLKEHYRAYAPLTQNGGKYYNIEARADFREIIDTLAVDIARGLTR